MKAKNTSPAASVRRFNGGQIAYDGDEGIVKNTLGRSTMKATNLDWKPTAKAKTGQFTSNVGCHPGAPWGLAQQIDGDEKIMSPQFQRMSGSYKDSNKTEGKAAKVSPSKMPARVGGGHPRKHQG